MNGKLFGIRVTNVGFDVGISLPIQDKINILVEMSNPLASILFVSIGVAPVLLKRFLDYLLKTNHKKLTNSLNKSAIEPEGEQ